MKTREWILIIFLISIIQAFIWYVSFIHSNNQSALGYISFAGTIISIILAVVAIVYNFTESIGQKNKSDLLSIQIEKLRTVVSNIDTKSDSLNVISEISQELSSFKDTFDKRIGETNEKILSIQDNWMSLTKQNITVDFDKDQVVNALSKNRSALYEISILMICSLNKVKINKSARIQDFRKIVDKPIAKADKKFRENDDLKGLIYPYASKTFIGATLALYIIFLDFGLIKENDQDLYEVSDELLKVTETFESNWSQSGTYYTEIRENIVINK